MSIFFAFFWSSTIIGNPAPGVILGETSLPVLGRSLQLTGAWALPCGGGEVELPLHPGREAFAAGLPALPTDMSLCGLRLQGLSLRLTVAQRGGPVPVELWVPHLDLELPAVRLSDAALPRLVVDLGAGDWLRVPIEGVAPGSEAHDLLVAGLVGSARVEFP